MYGIHITPLVINSLGDGHTHTHTYTHTHTHTHTQTQTHTNTDNPHRINFKKPGVPRPMRTWFNKTLWEVLFLKNSFGLWGQVLTLFFSWGEQEGNLRHTTYTLLMNGWSQSNASSRSYIGYLQRTYLLITIPLCPSGSRQRKFGMWVEALKFS